MPRFGFYLAGLLAALAAALTASPARAADGTVVYVVNGAAYLDKGAKDGLVRGAELTVVRAQARVAQVRVVDVADHTAVAEILAPGAPRVRDTFALPATAPAVAARSAAAAAATAPVARVVVPFAERDLAGVWSRALAARVPERVVYDKRRAPDVAAHGYAATVLDARSASGLPAAQRVEQLAYVRFFADDLGVAGLRLRTRAKLDLRYDREPDRYQTGRWAVPLVHEMGLHYQAPESGFAASLGRFFPLARFAGTIDGAEVAWAGKTVSLTGYGGVKPALETLAPRNAPAAGAAVIVHPALAAVPLSFTGGYRSEYDGSTASRQAVVAEGHAAYGTRVFADAGTSFDLHKAPGAAAAGFADADARLAGTIDEHATVTAGYRYDAGRLYPLEAAQYPVAWLPYLVNRTLRRVDADARLAWRPEDRWRPYAYWQQEFSQVEKYARIAAAGLAYHREGLFGEALALDVDGAYGDGTRQQADVSVGLASTGDDGFGWSAGEANHWTYGHDSGVHTFLNLLRVGAFWRLADELRLTASAQSALNSVVASTPAPAASWYRAETGVSYVW